MYTHIKLNQNKKLIDILIVIHDNLDMNFYFFFGSLCLCNRKIFTSRLQLRLRLLLKYFLSDYDYDYVIDYVINVVIDYIIDTITHL